MARGGDAPGTLAKQILQASAQLSPLRRRVARLLADEQPFVLASSAAELAARARTSDATVVRTVQALGFEGLAQLKRAIAAGLAMTPTSTDALRATLAQTGADMGRAVGLAMDLQRQAVEDLATDASRELLRSAVDLLHPARRIVVFGIGPSAPLAQYVALLLGRSGRSARALNATGIALADQLLDLQPEDVLLVMAYGQAYPEVSTLFAEAQRLSLPMVLFTDSLDPKLAADAAVVVPARRGHATQAALHGATLVALEAVALGLAAGQGERAIATLERLHELRHSITGGRGRPK